MPLIAPQKWVNGTVFVKLIDTSFRSPKRPQKAVGRSIPFPVPWYFDSHYSGSGFRHPSDQQQQQWTLKRVARNLEIDRPAHVALFCIINHWIIVTSRGEKKGREKIKAWEKLKRLKIRKLRFVVVFLATAGRLYVNMTEAERDKIFPERENYKVKRIREASYYIITHFKAVWLSPDHVVSRLFLYVNRCVHSR